MDCLDSFKVSDLKLCKTRTDEGRLLCEASNTESMQSMRSI